MQLLQSELLKGIPLRLLILGEGDERQQCLRLLHAAGAAGLAWLPGRRDDMGRLMRAMDAYAAPATGPASARHVLEAMASGLPVVASQGGLHASLVQGSWTGTLVAQAGTVQLADALADYARIPGLGRRHGQRARRHVLSHHSVMSVAERYTMLYDRLLELP